MDRDNMERRRHPRYPARILTEVLCGQHRIQAESEDISLGGALIRSAESIRENEFTLSLYLADQSFHPVEIKGAVTHTRDDHTVGVRFVDPSPSAQKALLSYIISLTDGTPQRRRLIKKLIGGR